MSAPGRAWDEFKSLPTTQTVILVMLAVAALLAVMGWSVPAIIEAISQIT